MHFEDAFRIDLLVEECVIVEVKSIERMAPVHGKQLLTYLRLSNLRVGLLLNFNPAAVACEARSAFGELPPWNGWGA